MKRGMYIVGGVVAGLFGVLEAAAVVRVAEQRGELRVLACGVLLGVGALLLAALAVVVYRPGWLLEMADERVAELTGYWQGLAVAYEAATARADDAEARLLALTRPRGPRRAVQLLHASGQRPSPVPCAVA